MFDLFESWCGGREPTNEGKEATNDEGTPNMTMKDEALEKKISLNRPYGDKIDKNWCRLELWIQNYEHKWCTNWWKFCII